MSTKHVYSFGNGSADGDASMRDLLGGKGANLAEMSRLGLPVPPGFTLSTAVCNAYLDAGGHFPDGVEKQVRDALDAMSGALERRFGDPERPLLVSVRSGGRASMPGMMDTVLNIGLSRKTLPGLVAMSGNERFAMDSYRRLLQMYADVVMGMDGEILEDLLTRAKRDKGVQNDTELDAADLGALTETFEQAIEKHAGKPFPSDPWEQLWGGVKAVFDSWKTPRAREYRRIHKLPEEWGTACNVQAMVFGNLGEDCATGVAFTRDPATGENVFYGEYLKNAQGEDVVAGTRTPKPINRAAAEPEALGDTLEDVMPGPYKQLDEIRVRLEKHYKDMQDVEFTIERDKLWMLQTRNGKRTGFAALRIAVDMVDEGLIDARTAVKRVAADQVVQLLSPVFDAKEKASAIDQKRLMAKGLNAGPGAATGKIVFDAEAAVEMVEKGEKVVLVRIETSPEDIHGMHVAEGILTSRGGMTSHAAVVARGMGKPCIVGCGTLDIDYAAKTVSAGGHELSAGDHISIDGGTGEVIADAITTRPAEIQQVLVEKTMKPEDSEAYQHYAKLMTWADEFRRLGVRTNADTPEDSANAVAFGAEGIGLCRTEHMFFEGERTLAVREMIVSDSTEARRRALAKLLPMQRQDFVGIFRAMEGRPVTIRTLDPPLHEFLPRTDRGVKELMKVTGKSEEEIRHTIETLEESNPMLGHRGCRLGIAYPEITEMQARAIFEAAAEVKKDGIDVKPEVMIPLVSTAAELRLQREVVDRIARQVIEESGQEIEYLVGTMIELPRAALTADQIAQHAQFFSFGTNDLTQTTFGISRDDSGKFLPVYVAHKILPEDPFVSIDVDGVGQLVEIATRKGRESRPDIKLGICGEHGGDPASVHFCHRTGLDYVSCSPYRVPVARLAAAQAALED